MFLLLTFIFFCAGLYNICNIRFRLPLYITAPHTAFVEVFLYGSVHWEKQAKDYVRILIRLMLKFFVIL